MVEDWQVETGRGGVGRNKRGKEMAGSSDQKIYLCEKHPFGDTAT